MKKLKQSFLLPFIFLLLNQSSNAQSLDIKANIFDAFDEVGGKSSWYDHPQSTSYFFMSTGYGLHQGEGYYQNGLVFYNKVEYGMRDYLSLNTGMIPLFVNDFLFAFWLSPKLAFPIIEDKLNFSTGLMIFISSDANGQAIFGSYNTLTYGSRDRNISLSSSYGYFNGWPKYPMITASAMFRFSEKFYLITENHTFISTIDDEDKLRATTSLGIRITWYRFSIDAASFFQINNESGSDVLPWISVSLPF